MNAAKDGGPAFPVQNRDYTDAYGGSPGMSRRDWLAGQALPAVIKQMGAVQGIGSPTFWNNVSIHAYRAADTMLAEGASVGALDRLLIDLRVVLADLRVCRNKAATQGRVTDAEDINTRIQLLKSAIAKAGAA